MNEEIKEWQTQSVKHKVAYVLMMDGISFRYTEETGIVFSAPDFYVKNLIRLSYQIIYMGLYRTEYKIPATHFLVFHNLTYLNSFIISFKLTP